MNPLLQRLLRNKYTPYALAFVGGIVLTIIVYPSGSITKTERSKIEEEIRSSYETKLQESESILKSERESHQKEINSIKQETSKRELEMSTKINSLVTENSSLKQRTKMVTIEKIYPDGRIERKTISTSELESETQTIARIQQEADQKIKDTVDKLNEDHAKEIAEKTSDLRSKVDSLSTTLQTSERLLKEEREKTSSIIKNPRPFALGLGLNTDKQYTVETQYTFWGPVYLGASYDRGGISNDRAGLSLGIRF